MNQKVETGKKDGIIPFDELPLSDNFMFGEVMRKESICKLFLEALFQKKIAKIEFITKEKTFSDSYEGHGIRLDVYLEDSENTRYDVEMQRTNTRNLERRIRYYQSGIDRGFLEKGADYEDLPESFVIFICNFDYFKSGLAVYERVSSIKGCNKIVYDDGSHAIFLNSAYTIPNAPNDIVEFLDYIRTNDDSINPKGKLTSLAKELVHEVRSDRSKEVAYMTYAMKMRDTFKEGREEGREEGRKEGAIEQLCSLVYQKLLSLADAVNASHLSESDFLGWMHKFYPDYKQSFNTRAHTERD